MLHDIPLRQKITVMVAVMSAMFLVALDQTIVSTALSAIVNQFNSFSSLGFVITAYMLTSTVTVPLAGKLSDMYGRRPMILAGIVIFTLGSLLSGVAGGMTMLIVSRAIQGIGGGVIMANAFTIIGDLFPPRERSKWQGLIGAVFGMSSVIGPLLGGWLTKGQHLFSMTTDWRWNFFINVPIGIAAAYMVARFCPDIKHDSEHKPDYKGAAAISVVLTALILAVDNTETIFRGLISQNVHVELIKIVLWSIALLGTIVFVAIERRAAQPILPMRFFHNQVYRVMTIVMVLFAAGFMGMILYITQFNQQVYGADAEKAGLMLIPSIVGMMIMSIAIGQLVSKTGHYKRFVLMGLAIAAVGLFSAVFLTENSPYWQEAVMLFVTGVGIGMVQPILMIAVQNEFSHKDLGAASSSMQLFRGLGSTVGVAVLTGILTSGIMSSVGDTSKIPYIDTLKQSPAASKMLGDDATLSSDTLLHINTAGATIKEQAEKGIDASPAPAPVKTMMKEKFATEQNDFHDKVITGFTHSLHEIFLIAAVLLATAFGVEIFLKEKPLRGTTHTPDLAA